MQKSFTATIAVLWSGVFSCQAAIAQVQPADPNFRLPEIRPENCRSAELTAEAYATKREGSAGGFGGFSGGFGQSSNGVDIGVKISVRADVGSNLKRLCDRVLEVQSQSRQLQLDLEIIKACGEAKKAVVDPNSFESLKGKCKSESLH